MNITDFGWSDKITDESVDGKNLARITAVHKSVCHGVCAEGEINIYLSGKFHDDPNLYLVTGDFVRVSPKFIDEQNKPAAVVEEIYPRRSKLSRVAAGKEIKEQVLVSNLDYVFVVTSANEDFSVNRLQRYSLLAEQGGVTPVVILSKIDLVEKPDQFLAEIQERMNEIKVIPMSSVSQVGFEDLMKFLKPGSTSAFVGSSGVGKSTIVNTLLGEDVQKTIEIRSDDHKGRHATTARELFFLPDGGMIIDTAGLREVQVFAGEESLALTFQDVGNLIEQCKFSDCTHGNEPGCAIQGALESGELSYEEYDNFLKLQKEALYNERKMNKATDSNAKKRWKDIHQNYRARKKFEGKN